jgi:hypothetical protein
MVCEVMSAFFLVCFTLFRAGSLYVLRLST